MKKLLYAVLALTIATTLMAAKRPQWNKTSSNKMYQVYAGTVVVVPSNGLDVYSSSATCSPSIKLYGDTGEVEATLVDADVVTAQNVNVDTVTASGEITTGYGYYHARTNPQDADFKTANFTMDTNWHDLDISTIVPVGAKTVHLGVYGYDNNAQTWMKFRKNGDTGDTGYYLCWITNVATIQTCATIICPVDTGRTIEYRTSEAISDINITVLGWWK